MHTQSGSTAPLVVVDDNDDEEEEKEEEAAAAFGSYSLVIKYLELKGRSSTLQQQQPSQAKFSWMSCSISF